MTSDQRREFVAHCVKLLKERDHYSQSQWAEAMLQLELAAGVVRPIVLRTKKMGAFLEKSCPEKFD